MQVPDLRGFTFTARCGSKRYKPKAHESHCAPVPVCPALMKVVLICTTEADVAPHVIAAKHLDSTAPPIIASVCVCRDIS